MSDEIHQKLDRIIALIMATAPTHKLPGKLLKIMGNATTPEEAARARKAEMLRVFKAAGKNLPEHKKRNQNYPACIRLAGMEAVGRSILLHRSAQSKFFSPLIEHGEINSKTNAENTLQQLVDEGQLVVAGLHETKLLQDNHRLSTALVVFSPEEYEMAVTEVLEPQPERPVVNKPVVKSMGVPVDNKIVGPKTMGNKADAEIFARVKEAMKGTVYCDKCEDEICDGVCMCPETWEEEKPRDLWVPKAKENNQKIDL